MGIRLADLYATYATQSPAKKWKVFFIFYLFRQAYLEVFYIKG